MSSNLSNVELHILIIGAGIAGLSAATALKKCGHRVEIFDRSKFANEVGAAVTISPNGTRVLRALGFDFVKVGGVKMQFLSKYHAVTLEKMFVHDVGDAEEKYGAPHEAMHRQDLHSELLRLALDTSSSAPELKLYNGVNIVRIDIANAEIELSDGKVFKGDLLIGADGIHSVVRDTCLGKKEEPIDTGWQTYRFLLDREVVMQDKEIREMKGENARIIYDISPPGKMGTALLIWYECRNGEVQNFAAFYGGAKDQTGIEDFSRKADKATVLELFKHMSPKLLHIISQAPSILSWRVYERAPLSTFIYGRTLLVGDAAHPMTPATAAGATQAFEDAGALLSLFSNLTSTKDKSAIIAEKMELFDKVRLVRASRIQVGTLLPPSDGTENPLTQLLAPLEEKDDLPDNLRRRRSLHSERLEWDFKFDIFEKCRRVMEGKE